MSEYKTKEAILLQVQEVFRDVLDDDGLVLDKAYTPADVCGWDSMSHIMIVTTLEQKFGIKFTNIELENMSSVLGILSVLNSKL